jgi:hypothetical protein
MDRQLIESIAEATDIPLSPYGRLRLKTNNLLYRARHGLPHRIRQGLQRRCPPNIASATEHWLGQVLDARRICGCATLSRDPPVLFEAAVDGRNARFIPGRPARAFFVADRPEP